MIPFTLEKVAGRLCLAPFLVLLRLLRSQNCLLIQELGRDPTKFYTNPSPPPVRPNLLEAASEERSCAALPACITLLDPWVPHPPIFERAGLRKSRCQGSRRWRYSRLPQPRSSLASGPFAASCSYGSSCTKVSVCAAADCAFNQEISALKRPRKARCCCIPFASASMESTSRHDKNGAMQWSPELVRWLQASCCALAPAPCKMGNDPGQ